MATITFIRTKLHQPPPPSDLVERSRLVEKLNQGRERKLTLVSAPAGYGKSTAVSVWVETLNFPAAWLSLDEYDDDLVTFDAYVAEAVRTAYPDACRTFAPLLRASTPPPPHRFADAFLKLMSANLFTIALDDEDVWHRYHHLFGDLLRGRLQRTYTDYAIAGMHARASAWFAAQGLIDEAIGHALAAGDVVGAAELVESHRIELLNADQWRILEKWLDRLPGDIKAQRPHLLLAQAWVFNTRYAIWAIPPILERLAPLLADVEPEPVVQGEIDYFRGMLQYWQGQGEQSLASLERALDLLPPTYSQNRGEAWFYWGLNAQQTGRGDEAIGVLTQSLTDMLPHKSERSDALMARLVGSRTAIHLIAAQLFEANQTLQQIRMLAEQSDNIYIDVWSLYSLGNIHYGWHDLDKAAVYFEQAAQNLYANHVRAAIDNLAGLALTWQALGESEKAGEVLDRLHEFVAELQAFIYAGLARSCGARLALLRGDLDAAMRWQKGADLTADTGSMFFWLETPRITQCRVLVAEGSAASLEEADAKLSQFIGENQALHNVYQLIQLLPLQALLRQKQGRTDEALAALRRAVALGEPGGWVQPFAEVGAEMHPLLQMLLDQGVAPDYVRRLLTSTQTSMAAPAVQSQLALSSPLDLTNRDLDVLALLAQRLTNQEIADRLFLSPQTIKNYTSRLYQKLHVNNRRQAVAKARALGILSDPD